MLVVAEHVPVRLTVGELEPVRDLEALDVPLKGTVEVPHVDADIDADGQGEKEEDLRGEVDALGEVEIVTDRVAEVETEGEGELLEVALPERVSVYVTEPLPVALGDTVDEALADRLAVTEMDAVSMIVGVANCEKVPVMVSTMETLGVEEAEGTAVREPVDAALAVAQPEPVALAVPDTDAVAVDDTDMHAEGVLERDTIGHIEAVEVADTVGVGDTVWVGEKVFVAVTEGEEEAVFSDVYVSVKGEEPLSAAVLLAMSAPVEDTVTDAEGTATEGDTVAVRSAVEEDVVEADDVCVTEGVAERDAVAEKEALSVTDTLPQYEDVKVPTATVLEPKEEAVSCNDDDTTEVDVVVRLSAMVREGDEDTEGEGDRLRDVPALAEVVGSAEGTAVAEPVKQLVDDTEPVVEGLCVSLLLTEGVAEPEGERVYRAVPVAAFAPEGVPVNEPKKEGVERGGEGDSDVAGDLDDAGETVPILPLSEGDREEDVHREIEGVTDMEQVPDAVEEPAAAPRVGLLDTELESEKESSGDKVAKGDVVDVRTCVTDGTAVVLESAVVLAVEDAVSGTVPVLAREPVVKGVADTVLGAVRVSIEENDNEGEGEEEGLTLLDLVTTGDPEAVGDNERVGDTVFDAAPFVGEMEGEEDTLALGVEERGEEGEDEWDADTEGEAEAVVADAEGVSVRVAAPVGVTARELVARREPVSVGDSVAIKLSLGGALPVGYVDHDGEPEAESEGPPTVPLGDSEDVKEADSEGEPVCVGEEVVVSTGVEVPQDVGRALAEGVTVSVSAAVPVATGVPLRIDAVTRAEAVVRGVKDCVMVGDADGDAAKEDEPPSEALMDTVRVTLTDALPVTESVGVPATETLTSGEGEEDADGQGRRDGDMLLETGGESVPEMVTEIERQPEEVWEGDGVRVGNTVREAVGDCVFFADPVATSDADNPGEKDSEGEPEALCDSEGDPVWQMEADTLRLPEPEKLGEGESEGDTLAERNHEGVNSGEPVKRVDGVSDGEEEEHGEAVRECGTEPVTAAVGRVDDDADALMVAVEEGVEDREDVLEVEDDTEGLPDADTVFDADAETHPETEGVELLEMEGVAVVLVEPVGVAPENGVRVALTEPEIVKDAEVDCAEDTVGRNGDGDAESVSLLVGVAAAVAVKDRVGGAVGVAACDMDEVWAALGVSVSRGVAVPATLSVGTTCVDVGHMLLEGDAEGDTVSVPFTGAEGVAGSEVVALLEAVTPGEGVSSTPKLGDDDADAVRGAVRVGEDVAEAVAEGEAGEEAEVEGVDVPTLDGVPRALTDAEGVDVKVFSAEMEAVSVYTAVLVSV